MIVIFACVKCAKKKPQKFGYIITHILLALIHHFTNMGIINLQP